MESLSDIFGSSSINVNPVNAKYYLAFFSSSDNRYDLYPNNETDDAFLFYVDRDVTIKGTETDIGADNKSRTENYNISLKAGWNYYIESESWTENNWTTTLTASQSLPNGFNWTVWER